MIGDLTADALGALTERIRKLEAADTLQWQYVRQYASGDLYMSRNPLGLDGDPTHVTDFWMDTGNQKLRIRAAILSDLDNRAQIIGARYNSNPAIPDGYTIGNFTVGTGDALLGIQAYGAVAGLVANGTRPDIRPAAVINFFPDTVLGGWSNTNNAGYIQFYTQPYNAGGGDFTWPNAMTFYDTLGNWLFGSPAFVHDPAAARLTAYVDPGNVPVNILTMRHRTVAAAGQTGAQLGINAFFDDASGTGYGVEAVQIRFGKLNDFTTAANQDAYMRISTRSDGVLGSALSLYDKFAEFHYWTLFVAANGTTPSIRLPHGTAPASPTNGDMWTTTAGLFVRINGVTVGPLT